MTDLFLKVLEMSLMGSVVILVTLLLRYLLRNRSKRFIMILWAVVAIRLLLPFSVESAFSIFNLIPMNLRASSEVVEISEEAAISHEEIDARQLAMELEEAVQQNNVFEYANEEAAVPAVSVNANAAPDVKTVLGIVWITGTSVIAAYCVTRYFMLKRKLKGAKWVNWNIYESDTIKAPFVFGFISPKIYLPDVLDKNEREYILMHEKTHIKHGDWLFKILGMAIVAVHWFNPLVWISYFLFEQDIEMSCDETTVANMDEELKQAYAISLVSFANRSNSRRYLVTPLGFAKKHTGRSEIRNRINNIINYKQGSKVTTVVITLALLATSAVCGFDSKSVEEITEEPVTDFETNEEPDEDLTVYETFDFNMDIPTVYEIPSVKRVSDKEKEITFFREGEEVKGKLKLPAGNGKFATIVMIGSLHTSYYDWMAEKFNAYGYATIQIESSTYMTAESDAAIVYDQVVDLYTVLDEVMYLNDVDKDNLYLLGHSQGGYISAFVGAYNRKDIKGMIIVDPVLSEDRSVTFAIAPEVEVTGIVNIYSVFSDCNVNTVLIGGEKNDGQQDSISKAAGYLPKGEAIVIDNADNLLCGQYGEQMVDDAVLAMKSWG